MSDLVQVSNSTAIAQNPIAGGFPFGGNSRLFRLKPAQVELQQKTSRAEGSQEGKFRVTDTGAHFEQIQGVLIFEPAEKRSYYQSKNEFGVPPLCYSNDGIEPSDRSQQKQALRCANCRQSSWATWQKTKKSDDLPKCKNRYEMTIVDRTSKVPYKLSVRGKSISPMSNAMQEIARLAELYRAENNGQYPNLFDFSFNIKSQSKRDNSGVYYVMVFSDIKMIREEDRAEFGALYQKFVAAQNSGELNEEAAQEDMKTDEAMTEENTANQYKAPDMSSNAEVTI